MGFHRFAYFVFHSPFPLFFFLFGYSFHFYFLSNLWTSFKFVFHFPNSCELFSNSWTLPNFVIFFILELFSNSEIFQAVNFFFVTCELFFSNSWTFSNLQAFPNFVKFFSNQWNVLKSQRSTDLVRGQRSMASRSTIYPFKKNSNPCVFLFANFFFHIFKYYKKAGSRKNRTKKTIERLTIVRANEWME